MMKKINMRKERGSSLTGYGLVVGLISVLAIGAVVQVGDGVSGLFVETGTVMEEVAAAQSSGGGAETGGATSNPPPSGCPNIGDMCDDGSVYAGFSPDPDGTDKMYIMPCDRGMVWDGGTMQCTGVRGNLNWGSGALGVMTFCTSGSGMTEDSCNTGEANTVLLSGLAASFPAADYCADLAPPDAVALGHDDWYLPAIEEFTIIDSAKFTGVLNGSFVTVGTNPAGYYWSSSQSDPADANSNSGRGWIQRLRFTNNQIIGSVYSLMHVRCARRHP